MTDTPTPAPAPMTASRLRKLMEETTPGPWEAQFSKDWSRVVIGTPERVIVLRGFAGNYENEANDQMLVAELVTAAPTILRLLEAVEGAEKALERIANHTDPHGDVELSDGGEQDVALFARSALATLRAAREVKP